MIDLRRSESLKLEERKFVSQLEKEQIPFRFGSIKFNNENHKSIFLLNRYAVSFDNISENIKAHLIENKFIPQKWDRNELRWQELELRKRLPLHR